MAKLRHIAIAVPDIQATARFYESSFGMQQVRESDVAVMLSDGLISLAVIDSNRNLNAENRTGLHHFGFLVEDMDEIKRRLELMEVPAPYEKPNDGRYAELGAIDVEGNRFDLSLAGWATERDQPDS